MPFTFRLPSRETIAASRNGHAMLQAIETDFVHRSIMINGCPGSGKTTISIYRLIRLHQANRRVLLFTFQKMLVIAIKNLAAVENVPSNKVWSLFKWYSSKTGGGWFEQHGNRSLPTAEQIVEALNRTNLAQERGHELIIDEGQDFNIKVYNSLTQFFDKITIGADQAQQVHPDRGADVDEIVESLETLGDIHRVLLEFNYRNPFEIYYFARQFVPDDDTANNPTTIDQLREDNEGNADIPVVFIFNTQEELNTRLRQLIQDNIEFNIAVLLNHTEDVDRYHNIIATGLGINCSKYHSRMNGSQIQEVENNLLNILVTTFISAKGMEFDVVIIPDFQAAESEYKNQYYVGCTRAIRNLFIMCIGDKPDIMNAFEVDSYELITQPPPPAANDNLPF